MVDKYVNTSAICMFLLILILLGYVHNLLSCDFEKNKIGILDHYFKIMKSIIPFAFNFFEVTDCAKSDRNIAYMCVMFFLLIFLQIAVTHQVYS